MRYYRFWDCSVSFLFPKYHISNAPFLDSHSLIRPFYINTENEAFSHVNTQITVAEGTIKPGTSGLTLSHTHEHRPSWKDTY